MAEGRNEGRYYFGVYSASIPIQGMTGLGLTGVPGSLAYRSALGWDSDAPNNEYFRTFAHELGHNLGRLHAPCGTTQKLDPSYPYPDGRIGAFGFDAATGMAFDPGATYDLMGYCRPEWVSDYTYKGILEFRAQDPSHAQVAALGRRPESLMVSGMMGADGGVDLEPAFQVRQEGAQPEPGGYTLVCRDSAGGLLQEVPFSMHAIADAPGGQKSQTFELLVPTTRAMKASLASLAVVSGGHTLAERHSAPLAPIPADAASSSLAGHAGTVRLTWDPHVHPRVLVRDAATGSVLGFGEGGSMDFSTGARELELLLSDGVRSVTRKVNVSRADGE